MVSCELLISYTNGHTSCPFHNLYWNQDYQDFFSPKEKLLRHQRNRNLCLKKKKRKKDPCLNIHWTAYWPKSGGLPTLLGSPGDTPMTAKVEPPLFFRLFKGSQRSLFIQKFSNTTKMHSSLPGHFSFFLFFSLLVVQEFIVFYIKVLH